MSMGWVFFTKVEDHDCVSNLTISMMTSRKIPIEKHILRNIARC